MLLLCTSTLLLSFTAQPSLLNSPILTSTRRHAAAVAASTPPPPLSRLLLLGDAGALLTWSLGLSTARTLALAGPDFDAASDLVSFMLESTMNMTVHMLPLSFSSLALTLAWLVAAAIGGALDEDWFARTQSADASALFAACSARGSSPSLWPKGDRRRGHHSARGGWLALTGRRGGIRWNAAGDQLVADGIAAHCQRENVFHSSSSVHTLPHRPR